MVRLFKTHGEGGQNHHCGALGSASDTTGSDLGIRAQSQEKDPSPLARASKVFRVQLIGVLVEDPQRFRGCLVGNTLTLSSGVGHDSWRGKSGNPGLTEG